MAAKKNTSKKPKTKKKFSEIKKEREKAGESGGGDGWFHVERAPLDIGIDKGEF